MRCYPLILIISAALFSRVILNEIMFNTAGNENNDEFIEIYNNSATPVDLSGWSIGDQDELDLLKRYKDFPDMVLKPYSYCVVMDSSYYLNSVYYEDLIPDSVLRVMINDGSFGSYGLSNTIPETVSLFDADSVLSDSYIYSLDQAEDISDERISFSSDDWSNSKTAKGTPGYKNSVFPFENDLELSVKTVPYLIDPSAPNSFMLKVMNSGSNSASGFTIEAYLNETLSASAEYTSVLSPNDSALVEVMLTFPSSGTVQLKFILQTETDEDTTDNTAEITLFVPYPAPPLVLNEFMSIPGADQCEYVEIFNISATSINLGDFGLSDEDKTRAVYFPGSLIDPGAYAVMAKNDLIYNFEGAVSQNIFLASGMATLNNETDKIFLLTKNGGVVDSIQYSNFASTGKSVEKRSPELASGTLSNWVYCVTAGTPTKKNSAMPYDFDLKAASMTAPPVINPDAFNNFTAIIKNIGFKETAGLTVSLYIDGKFTASSQETPSPAPGDSVSVMLSVFFERSGTSELKFEVEVSGDENELNNSISATVFVPYPAPPLTLNEFLKNPSQNECEFIEIFNMTEEAINLSDFGLSDENKTNAVFFPDTLFLPGEFAVMAKDSLIYNFSDVNNSNIFISPALAALNNTSDRIFLLTKNGIAIDSLFYTGMDEDEGKSIEKINPAFVSNNLKNWVYCVNDGTPTKKNSVYQDPEDIGNSANFKISPKTATPNGDGSNDNLIISYEFDSAYVYLTMKVYNIKGQLIAKPLNGEYSSSSGNIVWNCSDDSGRTVDTGAYICLLKAKDDKGKVTDLKEAFYIAK